MSNAFDRWKATQERRALELRERQAALLGGPRPTSATTSSASAADPLGRFAPVGLGRWRVERAGSLTGGYGLGWVAYSGVNLDTHGAWFATWGEAMAHAVREAV